MKPSERLDAILRQLDLKPGQFFLGGSSGLALRDIRHIGDIDIGVTTRYWFELYDLGRNDDAPPIWHLWTTEPGDPGRRCDPPYLVRHIDGIEVNVFHSWRRRGADESAYNDYNLIFKDGIEIVRGWPCAKLSLLLRMKADAVMYEPWRAKDMTDIHLIARYLEVSS